MWPQLMLLRLGKSVTIKKKISHEYNMQESEVITEA